MTTPGAKPTQRLFRKRPVVIEAMQLHLDNAHEVAAWVGPAATIRWKPGLPYVDIKTLEGTMTTAVGSWVIKGVQGEFYPCDPAIFAETYEAVDA